MFCSQCGTEAASADRFCRSCGRELATPASQPARPAAAGSRPIEERPPARGWTPPATSPTTTPPPPIEPLQLAGSGRRIGAFAIDLVITVISLFVVAVIVLGVHEAATGTDWDLLTEEEQDRVMGWAFLIWAPLFFVGTWALNAAGASLGKRILGLRIVRADLTAPGIGAGFGRTIGAWLSWPVIGLGYLWGTWDDRKQTWHDKMASTYVVRAELVAGPPARPNPPTYRG